MARSQQERLVVGARALDRELVRKLSVGITHSGQAI
jgi:hypothetical protein